MAALEAPTSLGISCFIEASHRGDDTSEPLLTLHMVALSVPRSLSAVTLLLDDEFLPRGVSERDIAFVHPADDTSAVHLRVTYSAPPSGTASCSGDAVPVRVLLKRWVFLCSWGRFVVGMRTAIVLPPRLRVMFRNVVTRQQHTLAQQLCPCLAELVGQTQWSQPCNCLPYSRQN